MVQYPRPYGFTRLYASRPEDLTITSLTETCFNPAHTSTPRGAFSPCCRKQRNRLLNHIAISSRQILSYGWVNQSPNDSIAVASNTRPSDYETDALTTTPSQLYTHEHLFSKIGSKLVTKTFYWTALFWLPLGWVTPFSCVIQLTLHGRRHPAVMAPW